MIIAGVRYAMSFYSWNLKERLELLDAAHIDYKLNYQTESLVVTSPLFSSQQEEVFKFAVDPIYPIKFWRLDLELGKAALDLHYNFWMFKFTR